ncbi:amino acid ABC transporter permease [Jatrophihabitans sp. YIM 134969]
MSTTDRVLFDAPGPRGRRRVRVATVVVAVVVAALVVVAVLEFAAHGQLEGRKWLPFRVSQIWTKFLLPGLGDTLVVTAVATVFALPLGVGVALARLSRTGAVRWLARGYVELFRSLPVLLLLYVFQLGLPRAGLTLPVFWQLTIPIVISSVAYTAALVGAGVQSLDRGQVEAAQSIGLRYWPMMRLVVLPQVLRRLLPALITEVVAILIATTLGYAVSYTELLHNAQTIGQFYQVPVQAYLVVAVLYIAVNGLLSWLATLAQRRQVGRRLAVDPQLAGR